MIKEFVKAWDKNKENLRYAIATDKDINNCDYFYLVKLLFEHVINPEAEFHWHRYDINNILVIDDGDYQGTKIFVLHRDTYQPSVDDYVYTNTYYGSCSGCDTLLDIQDSSWNKSVTDEQVDDYMTLCLHLLQRCNRMEYGEEYD